MPFPWTLIQRRDSRASGVMEEGSLLNSAGTGARLTCWFEYVGGWVGGWVGGFV